MEVPWRRAIQAAQLGQGRPSHVQLPCIVMSYEAEFIRCLSASSGFLLGVAYFVESLNQIDYLPPMTLHSDPLVDACAAALHRAGLELRENGQREADAPFVLRGNTYANKELLKQHGGR
jgi:hypothetical protein